MKGWDRSRIETLQAGRASAALAVVVHHAALAAHDFGGLFPGYSIAAQGYLGVDFFFVLSGFIIYHTTAGRGRSAKEYAAARLRRVFVPYLPIGIGIALLYTLLPSLSAGGREWSWLPTLTLLPVQAQTALSVAWTLKHEMLFYGIFAALYFSNLLWIGLAAWGAAILLLPSQAIAFAPINLEFLFGILAARAYRQHWTSAWLLLPAGLAVSAWVYLGCRPTASVLIGLAVAFVIPVITGLERQGKLRTHPSLVYFGAVSYSLYLIHGLAISIIARIVPGWQLIMIVGIAASLVAGVLYHHIIEKPLLGSRRPLSARP